MEVHEPALKYYPKMSSAEYLIWEQEQNNKHEYIEGSIIAMAGASPKHNLILSNIIREVATHLKGTPCNIFPGDLKVFVKSKDSYFYPDATIVCGDINLSDDKQEAVKNPEVIFEILSPSTEDFDLGKKILFLYANRFSETIYNH